MSYTIHAPEPKFVQVDECEDIRDAQISATNFSLADMQSFILIMDNEKEVIAVYYKGEIFERRTIERE